MEKTTTYDIHERIHKFVLAVLKITRRIQGTPEFLVIRKQLIRSATSIGANACEADAAISRADFINKFRIAAKEARETDYWLRLLGDLSQKHSEDCSNLRNEATQILKIINAISYNAREKKPNLAEKYH